ncbi:MAG: hypothetical protein ACPG7U_02115 [Holosporaceae bacterium]
MTKRNTLRHMMAVLLLPMALFAHGPNDSDSDEASNSAPQACAAIKVLPPADNHAMLPQNHTLLPQNHTLDFARQRQGSTDTRNILTEAAIADQTVSADVTCISLPQALSAEQLAPFSNVSSVQLMYTDDMLSLPNPLNVTLLQVGDHEDERLVLTENTVGDVGQFQNVRYLTLENLVFSNTTHPFTDLQAFKGLVQFKFANAQTLLNDNHPAVCRALKDFFAKNKSLELVSLSTNQPNGLPCHQLADAFAELVNVRFLQLWGFQLDNQDLAKIPVDNLEHLYLGVQTLRDLAHFIPRASRLKVLHLRNDQDVIDHPTEAQQQTIEAERVAHKGAAKMLKMLDHIGQPLQQLCLSSTFTNNGAFFEAFSNLQHRPERLTIVPSSRYPLHGVCMTLGETYGERFHVTGDNTVPPGSTAQQYWAAHPSLFNLPVTAPEATDTPEL